METTPFYRTCLKEELALRCERNRQYSVRAFARAIRTDAGALSRILSGKQVPSLKLAQQLMSALDLEPKDQQGFLASLAEEHRSRGMKRLNPFFRKHPGASAAAKELSIDVYRVISEWYHTAILELTFTENFQSSPAWIAQQIGINEIEAKLAIERLLNVGLLKNENGQLTKTNEQLSTADKHLTTPALRKNQKQLLERAIQSLEEDPIEERSMTSMTMAIDETKLPLAKQMIREFNQTLCKFLESGKKTRVYNLGVALYPLQKKTKEKT